MSTLDELERAVERLNRAVERLSGERAELLATVESSQAMLALYRVGTLRAFDALCETCRGGAVVSERTRTALTTGEEK